MKDETSAMTTPQPRFDRHDAIVLYAALSAGEKGITSQGIVLLSDYIEHAATSGQTVDKSLDRLQNAHLLKKRGQVYLASRDAAEQFSADLVGQPVPAAIEQVYNYLQTQTS